MLVWPYRWAVDQGPHSDVNMGTISNDRIKQRPTDFAVCVAAIFFAEDHEVLMPACKCKDQPVSFDTGEAPERRTCRAPAVGAMAVGHVKKLIRSVYATAPQTHFPASIPTARIGNMGPTRSSTPLPIRSPDMRGIAKSICLLGDPARPRQQCPARRGQRGPMGGAVE